MFTSCFDFVSNLFNVDKHDITVEVEKKLVRVNRLLEVTKNVDSYLHFNYCHIVDGGVVNNFFVDFVKI